MLDLFYRQPRLVVVTIALILVSGLAALHTLPRMEDPRFANRNALVVTRWSGASAERVEALISRKLEEELQRVQEIKELISRSRAGVSVIKQKHGSDPAAVAFDTLESAKRREADVVIIDTAGRLHTKGGLMDELSKIKRVMGRQVEQAPHEVLLVLDASTGQNAIRQAEEFTHSVDVTGLVLTKLDGTAKGGIVIGISNEFKIPVKYIGVGERLEDLQVFDRQRFVEALFK